MSETKTNVLVIELVNQQPSSFVLDGAGVGVEGEELKTNITAPNAQKILNKSKYVKKDENGVERLVPIRYIKGCDEIHVEKQKEMGVEPNPIADVIWVLNGTRSVTESQGEVGLFRFLQLHEGNVDNPHRPSNAVDKFRVISTAVQAQQEETLLDQEFKVMEYLSGLKSRNAKGGTDYNTEAIDFLCRYFKIPGVDMSNPSEAWVALVQQGKSHPETFLSSVASFVSVIESEVQQAFGSGIIAFADGNVEFTKTKKVMLSVEKGEDAELDEVKSLVVAFLSNPTNRVAYDHLRSELHAAKMKSTGVLV